MSQYVQWFHEQPIAYILQATIGCSWNHCTYCDMYRDKEFRVRVRPVGLVLYLRAATQQVFYRCASVTLVVLRRKSRHVGADEQGHVPSGSFRAGDNNPRIGAQQVGAEQLDSQLMMAD